MLFTEGKDRNYERMMQEKPGFQRDRRRTVSPNARQRDCPIPPTLDTLRETY